MSLPSGRKGVNRRNVDRLGNVQSGAEYTDEEQIVGKWIDGKPIYRKVVQYTTASESGTSDRADISTLNIKDVVKFESLIKVSASIYPIPYYVTTSSYVYARITGTKIIVNQQGHNSKSITSIIEYTKNE